MGTSFIVTVVLVVALATCCLADDADEAKKEQAKEMFRGMAQDCKNEEKATDSDVEDLIADKTPETEVQKCFLACIQKQFGISDGKKFSKDGFVEISRMIFGKDEAKMKQVKEIGEECSEVANEDRCLLAVDIKSCIETGMEKRGIAKER